MSTKSTKIVFAICIILLLTGCAGNELPQENSVRPTSSDPSQPDLNPDLDTLLASALIAKLNDGNVVTTSLDLSRILAENRSQTSGPDARAAARALEQKATADVRQRTYQQHLTTLTDSAQNWIKLARPATSADFLVAILAEQAEAIQSFAIPAPPLPENAPRLFVAQQWPLRGALRPSLPLVDPAEAAEMSPQPARPVLPNIIIDSDTRPNVLRYACCTGVEVLDAPLSSANVIARLSESEMVWVFDLLPSTGLNTALNGLSTCAGSMPTPSASCINALTALASHIGTTIYADVHVPGQNLSGYVPIQALFVRPITPLRGETVFEIGYDRLAESLRQGIRDHLTQPPHCGNPGNIIVVRASDFGHNDIYYNPLAQSSVRCDFLLGDECVTTLISCADVDPASPAFERCVYEEEAECDGPRPDRTPSPNLYMCSPPQCRLGRAICSDCRQWYAQTGQDHSGWKTQNELVDICLNENIDTDIPINCAEHMKTFMASACSHYIGPVDERSFADPKDYACGELPVGQTHLGLWQDTATGELIGSSDQDSKRLAQFPFWGGKRGFIDMGRLDQQRSITFSNLDLTTGQSTTVPASNRLRERNFWISFQPTRTTVTIDGEEQERDILLFNACVHIPGVSVDGNSITYNPTDDAFALIQKIDFGHATIERAKICAVGQVVLLDNYKPRVDWLYIDDFDAVIGDIAGVDFQPGIGLVAIGLTAPLGELLLGALLQVEMIETGINVTDIDTLLATFALRFFEDRIKQEILGELDTQTREALEKLEIEPRQRLNEVCEQLTPPVEPEHPYFYFYRFLEAQCDGFIASHSVDPFQRNAASETAGCYESVAYITPDDAGRQRWWAGYMGQQWYFPFWPDQGCRISTHVQSNLDRAMWPVMRCGTATFNAWFNNGPTAPHNSLPSMVTDFCDGPGHRALLDLYGDGQDLRDLYMSVHQPGPFQPDPAFQPNPDN